MLQVYRQLANGWVFVNLDATEFNIKHPFNAQGDFQACQRMAAEVKEVPVVLQRVTVNVQGLAP